MRKKTPKLPIVRTGLAKIVFEHRQKMQLNRTQFGKRLGTDGANVMRWEDKGQTPSPEAMDRLASFMGMTTAGLHGLAQGHNPYGLAPDELIWLDLYRKLDGFERKRQAIRVVEALDVSPGVVRPIRQHRKKRQQ